VSSGKVRPPRDRKYRPRRHPALVTSDRLKADYKRWHDLLDDHEQDAFGVVRAALERIAEDDGASDVVRWANALVRSARTAGILPERDRGRPGRTPRHETAAVEHADEESSR
jgi:hypothetical protein